MARAHGEGRTPLFTLLHLLSAALPVQMLLSISSVGNGVFTASYLLSSKVLRSWRLWQVAREFVKRAYHVSERKRNVPLRNIALTSVIAV
jgi:hypothetical protein